MGKSFSLFSLFTFCSNKSDERTSEWRGKSERRQTFKDKMTYIRYLLDSSAFFVPSASYSLPRRIWKLESLRFMMKQYLKYSLKRARINRRNVCIATELEWKNSQSICSADHTRVCTYYLYQRANAGVELKFFRSSLLHQNLFRFLAQQIIKRAGDGTEAASTRTIRWQLVRAAARSVVAK